MNTHTWTAWGMICDAFSAGVKVNNVKSYIINKSVEFSRTHPCSVTEKKSERQTPVYKGQCEYDNSYCNPGKVRQHITVKETKQGGKK